MRKSSSQSRAVALQIGSPGLRALKQTQTRNAIWDAAIDLFAEKGFDSTTIDEIAAVAQVARRSFFRYFESKSDLMAQPILDLASAITRAVESCPRNGSQAELLRFVVTALATASVAHPRTRKVMAIAEQCPAARDALLSRMAAVQPQIEAAFRLRCKSPLTAQVLASLTVSALSLVTRHWFENGRKSITPSLRKIFAILTAVTAA